MSYRPVATIIIILISFAVTFMAPVFDTSVYGINGHPTEWLSFLPSTPWRHKQLSLFFSPFLHINFLHFINNMVMFTPIAMIIERKKSGFFLILTFFSIHFHVLLLLVLINVLSPMGNKTFLGSSHVIIGLYTFWSLSNKKYSMLFWPLLVIAIGLWDGHSLSLLAHVLGFIVGVEHLLIGRLCNKFCPKRSN